MHSPLAEQRKLAFKDVHSHPCLDTGDHDGETMEASANNYRALGGVMLSANASGSLGCQFKIEPTDQLYCVDSDGITCSQVMHVLLRRVCRRIDDFEGVIHPPVATERFEPVDMDVDHMLFPTCAIDTDGFKHAFAVKRSLLFGESDFEAFLGGSSGEYRSPDDDLFKMTRSFFDARLYAPPPTGGRRVFFAFNEAVQVVLDRLVHAARVLEACKTVDQVQYQQYVEKGRTEPFDPRAGVATVDGCAQRAMLHRSPLEGVVVVGLPFGDDAATPAGEDVEPLSAAAFKRAYEKYEQVLEVPHSAQILQAKQFYDRGRKVKGIDN